MEIIGNIVSLLAGCGLFMLGFKLLSTNMEKLAGNSLKTFFNKISNNKFLGLFIGMLTTIVIQSSSVTTVMVVGFVNSAVMTLAQAASVIIGANVGTTITTYIAALNSGADVLADALNYLFLACLFIGVFLEMFSKKCNIQSLGLVLAGLGAVFMGLDVMSGSMKFLQGISEVQHFIGSLDNPFLLLLIGILFTAIVQSSSAVTSIIVIIAATNTNAFGGSGNAVYFLILGSNIGTCVTAMISSVGATTNARRASMIHLLFNTFGAVIFAILLFLWPKFSETLIESWITEKQWQIAVFHTMFNVICAIIFLPLSNVLVNLASKLVKDKEAVEKPIYDLVYMDKRLLSSPHIAVDMLNKDIFRMADLSIETLKFAFDKFVNRNDSAIPEIENKTEQITKLAENITNSLVAVSSSHSVKNLEVKVNNLHSHVGDIVRVAELAENLGKYTRKEVKENLYFSEDFLARLDEMCQLIYTEYDYVKLVCLENKLEYVDLVNEYEDKIDNMRRELVKAHLERLSQGKCKPENNAVFINLVSNLERVGDHISFIAQKA